MKAVFEFTTGRDGLVNSHFDEVVLDLLKVLRFTHDYSSEYLIIRLSLEMFGRGIFDGDDDMLERELFVHQEEAFDILHTAISDAFRDIFNQCRKYRQKREEDKLEENS